MSALAIILGILAISTGGVTAYNATSGLVMIVCGIVLVAGGLWALP